MYVISFVPHKEPGRKVGTFSRADTGVLCWRQSPGNVGEEKMSRNKSFVFTVFLTSVIASVQIGFGHVSPQGETIYHDFFCLIGGKKDQNI